MLLSAPRPAFSLICTCIVGSHTVLNDLAYIEVVQTDHASALQSIAMSHDVTSLAPDRATYTRECV